MLPSVLTVCLNYLFACLNYCLPASTTVRLSQLLSALKLNAFAACLPAHTTSLLRWLSVIHMRWGMCQAIKNKNGDLANLTLWMQRGGLVCRDRTWDCRTHRKCFIGQEAVNWLISCHVCQVSSGRPPPLDCTVCTVCLSQL